MTHRSDAWRCLLFTGFTVHCVDKKLIYLSHTVIGTQIQILTFVFGYFNLVQLFIRQIKILFKLFLFHILMLQISPFLNLDIKTKKFNNYQV